MTVTTVYGNPVRDYEPGPAPVVFWRDETGWPHVSFHERTRVGCSDLEDKVVDALTDEIARDPTKENVRWVLYALIEAMVKRENEAHRYDCSDL